TEQPRFNRSTRFGSTDKGQPRRSNGAPMECVKELNRGTTSTPSGLAPSNRNDYFPSCMAVLDTLNGGGHVGQRESAVNHGSDFSRFAEFLQHQQISLIGLPQHVTEPLTAEREQWSEQQSVGQLAVGAASH